MFIWISSISPALLKLVYENRTGTIISGNTIVNSDNGLRIKYAHYRGEARIFPNYLRLIQNRLRCYVRLRFRYYLHRQHRYRRRQVRCGHPARLLERWTYRQPNKRCHNLKHPVHWHEHRLRRFRSTGSLCPMWSVLRSRWHRWKLMRLLNRKRIL